MSEKSKQRKKLFNPATIKIIILILTCILTLFALILPESFNQSTYAMQIGEVANQDILAPYSLTYESDVLTEDALQAAANSVDPIYLPTDPGIGRRQVEKLRVVLYYITTIRQDDYATLDEKIADIQSIEDVSFSEETIRKILQISDMSWEAIAAETTDVLEQIMRNTLRESDIYAAVKNIPSMIDFSFPESQANIVAELVEPFIIPNSLFSEEQTQAAITEAQQDVEPVEQSFITGETLVRRGQIIREVDWEALERYGLIQADNRTQDIIGAGVLVILAGLLTGLYFHYQKDDRPFSIKALILIAITFLFFLSMARFFVIERTILPYVYPLTAFGLTLAIIFNFEVGSILLFLLGILTAYSMPNGLDLTLFYIIPGIVGMLSLRKARRISNFLIAGIAIGLSGIGIILAFRLPDSMTDLIGIATLSGVAVINGIGAAGVTLLFQFVFSQILGITTPLQLLDTSRPDHPLLQKILRSAPGTYQHSLQVANLAEQAAESIGADGLLVRVGAIYHDCGKTLNPQFFIENQVQDKLNPHDDIDPVTSAQTIINHVVDGVKLAEKHRLPNQIIDFIREHHGTLHTRYQYTQAVKAAGGDPEKVDINQFRYPGPRPQSRETALLMLADGTEARARAEVPKDEEALRILINEVFDFYEKHDQLADTNLTLKDLELAKASFFRTLKGTYHPRIKYPELGQAKTKTAVSDPTAETVKAKHD